MLSKEQMRLLDAQKERILYGRITALTHDEMPIEQIEGRVATGGSIALDGQSSLRRSCSLTLLTDKINFNEHYWALNTKFKLELGLDNSVLDKEPEIIWFNMGIYVNVGFNYAYNVSSYKINISGKDKMCLLNGDISGSLMAETDFGSIEEIDIYGNVTIRQLPIEEIIRNAVHEIGGEPLHKIIIKDLPSNGFELLEYRQKKPMYLYSSDEIFTGKFNNVLFDDSIICIVDGQEIALADCPTEYFIPLTDAVNSQAKQLYIEDSPYWFAKINYGDAGGYKPIELVYAEQQLIGKVGESITSILDKIVKMLGQFEYFYDANGIFVFQMKQAYLKTMYAPTANEDIVLINEEQENYSYIFDNADSFTTVNDNTNINNIKNDYSIWGQRRENIPIHYRFAIDTKPTQYKSITVSEAEIEAYNKQNKTALSGQKSVAYKAAAVSAGSLEANSVECDWREVIYRMAADYFKYHYLDDFLLKVQEANPSLLNGSTGYEQYYTDLQGFWRQLYIPPWELQEQIRIEIEKLNAMAESASTEDLELKIRQQKAIIENLLTYDEETGWLKNVFEAPELLNFWFDFLDTDGDINRFNVKRVGFRTKSVYDTNIKSIYYKEIPSVLVVDDINKDEAALMEAYTYIQVPQYENKFIKSSRGISAQEKINELLYAHTYTADQLNITAVPIYYLEPNSRIYIRDQETGLIGDYIISRINYQLNYNGTMTITASKAAIDII